MLGGVEIALFFERAGVRGGIGQHRSLCLACGPPTTTKLDKSGMRLQQFRPLLQKAQTPGCCLSGIYNHPCSGVDVESFIWRSLAGVCLPCSHYQDAMWFMQICHRALSELWIGAFYRFRLFVMGAFVEYSGRLTYMAHGLKCAARSSSSWHVGLYSARVRQIDDWKWDDDGTILMKGKGRIAPQRNFIVFFSHFSEVAKGRQNYATSFHATL